MKYCSSDISNVDITFHGGIISAILNMFRGFIGRYIKDKMSGIICKEVYFYKTLPKLSNLTL